MPGAKILLIEDNADILAINRCALQKKGYQTLEAKSLEEAEAALSANPSLILLDIMMPDGSGLDFCKIVRKQLDIPILFLTALSGSRNAVAGFAAGGDDYLSKPYDLEELVSRIEALLRRSGSSASKQSAWGSLTLDHISGRAYVSGTDLLLKPKEFSLLLLLSRHMSNYVPSRELFKQVWGSNDLDIRTVKSHIYRLRKQLGTSGRNEFSIEYEKLKGYRLVEN